MAAQPCVDGGWRCTTGQGPKLAAYLARMASHSLSSASPRSGFFRNTYSACDRPSCPASSAASTNAPYHLSRTAAATSPDASSAVRSAPNVDGRGRDPGRGTAGRTGTDEGTGAGGEALGRRAIAGTGTGTGTEGRAAAAASAAGNGEVGTEPRGVVGTGGRDAPPMLADRVGRGGVAAAGAGAGAGTGTGTGTGAVPGRDGDDGTVGLGVAVAVGADGTPVGRPVAGLGGALAPGAGCEGGDGTVAISDDEDKDEDDSNRLGRGDKEVGEGAGTEALEALRATVGTGGVGRADADPGTGTGTGTGAGTGRAVGVGVGVGVGGGRLGVGALLTVGVGGFGTVGVGGLAAADGVGGFGTVGVGGLAAADGVGGFGTIGVGGLAAADGVGGLGTGPGTGCIGLAEDELGVAAAGGGVPTRGVVPSALASSSARDVVDASSNGSNSPKPPSSSSSYSPSSSSSSSSSSPSSRTGSLGSLTILLGRAGPLPPRRTLRRAWAVLARLGLVVVAMRVGTGALRPARVAGGAAPPAARGGTGTLGRAVGGAEAPPKALAHTVSSSFQGSTVGPGRAASAQCQMRVS
jgi:hypothetical protein